MRVDVDVRGLDGVLDLLRSLPPEIVSKRGGPVRAALRKGALVIQRQAVANLQAAIAQTADPEERTSTGLLLKNVVVTRGKEPTGSKGERYLVRVRRKTYLRAKGKTTTLASAQLKEYGSSRQAPSPWLRPAFTARAADAIGVVETELLRAINRAVAKAKKVGA